MMDDPTRIIGQIGPVCVRAEVAEPEEDARFLADVAAEALGWQPLSEGVYLHVGAPDPGTEMVIHVVGIPDPGMAAEHVLLLT